MAPEESYPKLISLAVHELRTPANVIWGYLRMLQKNQSSNLTEHERRMVDEAEKSCVRLTELMTELSEVGKLDGEQLAMAKRPVDFFTLTGAATATVHDAEDRDVRVEVRGPAEGAPIDADPDRLRVAIASIVRSIVRQQPGPAVVVAERSRARRDGVDEAVVVVAVEAKTPAEDSARVPFNDKQGGMGLALPIARRVIEAHGGRIDTRSGTDAVITLPLNG